MKVETRKGKIMDSGCGKKKKQNADRLSNLSNDLIHKILSFITIKDTVKTIVLSPRYRFIWTTMPYLNFSTEDFPNLPKFSKFVTHFLSRRNSQIEVSSLKLSFRGKVTQPSVKKLIDYAFSHNIQHLDVVCLLENDIEFPLSLLGSHSLKHLSLKIGFNRWPKKWFNLKATSTLELSALTTLYLQYVTFCSTDDLLSKCANLKNFTLKNCKIEGLSTFSICHPGLSNLTLEFNKVKVNVVAPQLQNLTIRYDNNSRWREHVISAPNLASLVYRGDYPLRLNSTDGFHCLKEADICFSYPKGHSHQMVSLLQQIYNVKFLTLNLEIVEVLSSSMKLIAHEPSPFVNLKSLNVYPKMLYEWEMRDLPKGKANMSTEMKNYLLDSSPGAALTMFSREEIIALKDVASAKKLMAELRVLLEQEKANTKTKGKAPMESNNAKMHDKRKTQPEMKMQLQIGEHRKLIESYWKDLSVQFEHRKDKACLIIYNLGSIERLLKKLPATNRAMIQPCFLSLCAKADTVMSEIMKMQCDENQSRLSLCFHELVTATPMEPSS